MVQILLKCISHSKTKRPNGKQPKLVIIIFIYLLIFNQFNYVICIFYEVGVGSYGVVVAAKDHNNDSELVAVKKMINVFDHKTFARRTLR